MTAGHLRGRQCTIVGAGVAGLAVGAALAQRGAKVEICEQSTELAEIGAGIQLAPNAMRVIDALGAGDAVRRDSLQNKFVHLFDLWGRPVARLGLAERRPNDPYRLIHRARLISALADAAQKAGAHLNLGQRVTDLSGTPALLIGADGLHSGTRQCLNGRSVPFFTRQTAWRAVIDDPTGETDARVFMGPGSHLVSYPLKDNLRNLVAVVERDDWQDEGWSQPGDPEVLRGEFAGFGGPVPQWLGAVNSAQIWGLFRHDIPKIWHDDRQILIGDALHPTLPFLAQGAAMALEDAWCLARCLDQIPEPQRAFARFAEIREPRVRRLVQAANKNASNFHLKGVRRQLAHGLLRAANQIAPQLLAARYDWIYDHDATADP